MRAAFALRIISGKIIYNFAFVALCGALQTPFHGRGRNGKQHLQRRFLRKRGAAQAVTERVPSPFCEKNYRIWQSRQAKTGKSAPLLTLTN